MHNITIEYVLGLFILGAAVLAFLYHVVLFFFSRDRFLLHYLVYLFCMGIFLFAKSGLYAAFWGLEAEKYMDYAFREAIQIVYLTSYFNFIVRAIGISEAKKPFLFRYWPATQGILLLYAALFSYSKIAFPLQDYTVPFVAARAFIFAITGVMLYQSFRLRRIKFQQIILYGCTLYFLFGITSFAVNLYSTPQTTIHPLEWLMIGSFIDIIFFSFAIGYRNKKQWEKLNLDLLREANRHIALQKVVMEKQAELENERTRIAADMHDDLGSGLTKITYLTQMALKSDTQDNLKKINATASELVGNMSELIWVMKEENNTLEDLATYIKSYAVDYFQSNDICVSIEIPDFPQEIKISGNNRRNLFLSVKECFHNIVKHANAKNVRVQISLDGNLALSIQDDGTGMQNRPENAAKSGNGLKNMHGRMQRMNGEMTLNEQNGLQVCFKIPVEMLAKNQPLVSL